ncbi:hypothetical protein ACOI1C_16295 [Bacillus sp. DJP31]|uniref:hypothetical protein n=1 Tax=Bacillus sp. DJP31 TaxID=3409789 RepID=UPI003BB4FC24
MDPYKGRVKAAEDWLQTHKIDTWLIVTREGTDSSVPFLLGIRSVSLAFIFIRSNGEHTVLTSKSDQGNYEATDLFPHVHVFGENVEETFLHIWNELDCNRLALNLSESDEMSGGLTQGLFEWVESMIGENSLAEIEVSSEGFLKELLKTEIV